MLYFPFDIIENGNVVGDINATLYNNPLQVDGIRGRALAFDGTNQYADFGDQTSRCFGHVSLCLYGFTTMMWLNISAASFVPGSEFLFSNGGHTSTVSRGGIAVLVQNSLLYVTVRHGQQGLHWRINDVSVPSDTWFHLGIIWTQENGLKIYINGTKVAEKIHVSYTATSGNDATGIFMQLGKLNTNPDNAFGAAFYIDEWYFWETALTSEDISIMYQKYKSGMF